MRDVNIREEDTQVELLKQLSEAAAEVDARETDLTQLQTEAHN